MPAQAEKNFYRPEIFTIYILCYVQTFAPGAVFIGLNLFFSAHLTLQAGKNGYLRKKNPLGNRHHFGYTNEFS